MIIRLGLLKIIFSYLLLVNFTLKSRHDFEA